MFQAIFDKIVALIGILILSPLFLLVSIFIVLDSSGGVFFLQERIGKNSVPFKLIKFRTMRPNSEASGKLTIGNRDPRITRMGQFLRRYKIDELPQLFNVLNGTMNLVGPRPEVAEYVQLYSKEQSRVLRVKPGITDYASLEFFNENEILSKSLNPKQTYIDEIMPKKLEINLAYLARKNFLEDLKVIGLTISRIFS